ncbi:hypothetical protein Tco_1039955 [Tanacetum coccineum]
MLGEARVQIPEDNLDDLHSLKEEDGTSEIMDPQDLLAGLDVSLSRTTGFLRSASVVVVILVKGHAFHTIVKVRPVGCVLVILVLKNSSSRFWGFDVLHGDLKTRKFRSTFSGIKDSFLLQKDKSTKVAFWISKLAFCLHNKGLRLVLAFWLPRH